MDNSEIVLKLIKDELDVDGLANTQHALYLAQVAGIPTSYFFEWVPAFHDKDGNVSGS